VGAEQARVLGVIVQLLNGRPVHGELLIKRRSVCGKDRASVRARRIASDRPALGADVSPLRKPVNVDELDALIGEVLKRPKALSLSSTENHAVSPSAVELRGSPVMRLRSS
jgi:hypothetical protein